MKYYGFREEHILENFLIEKAGTAFILFPAKIIAISFIVIVLGFAPRVRDTLTIMLLG